MLNEYIDIISGSLVSILILAIVAYLFGSINFAIIVTKIMSKSDIRESGSGNAGLTNVLRSQGKKAAILTTLGDIAKSVASVFLGQIIIKAMNPEHTGSNIAMVGGYIAGLFCVIGHIYPLYFGFKGGKGVLGTFGMMLAVDWRVALICLSVFIGMIAITKMVSVGSICAAIALPIVTFLFKSFVDKGVVKGDIMFCTLMTTVIAIILVVKHIPNIKRIAAGTENKLFQKKTEKQG